MMYMISYINRQDDPQAQARFDAHVKQLGNWANRLAQNGVWIVNNPRQSASQIRDSFKPMLNAGDTLFVARISRNWAGTNMGDNFPGWMISQDFGKFHETEQGGPKS